MALYDAADPLLRLINNSDFSLLQKGTNFFANLFPGGKWQSGFLAVKGKVAEVLSQFDFGAGGGLVPYTIYEADEKTPLPGPFYIVNFGPWKDCFLPDASTKVEKLGVHHQTGLTHWSLSYLKDGDVAVSPAALAGSDLWMCPGVNSRIFMSNRVVEALTTALCDAA